MRWSQQVAAKDNCFREPFEDWNEESVVLQISFVSFRVT